MFRAGTRLECLPCILAEQVGPEKTSARVSLVYEGHYVGINHHERHQ